MRVLIAEDHRDLAESLARGLRRHTMEVELAHDGEQGLSRASSGAYDVIVLDRDLPLVHGDEICRALVRQGSPSRVLMLTAAGTLADRVDGLDVGADDYLAKPFSFAELIARVQALDRRDQPAVPPVQHRQGHRQPAAPQARRPAGHRDAPARRLPDLTRAAARRPVVVARRVTARQPVNGVTRVWRGVGEPGVRDRVPEGE